jgi:hypothetical protein
MNSEFMNNENIEMLWEIIYDDLKDELTNKENILDIQKYFLNNVRDFFEREKMTPMNLIMLNKKFITFVIPKIQEKSKQPKQNQLQNQLQNQQTTKNIMFFTCFISRSRIEKQRDVK